MYRFKLLLISCFLLLSLHTFSQQLIRSSINSFGSSYLSEGILFRQSVGQSSVIGTVFNDATLRQGFQQPLTTAATSSISKYKAISFTLFPNPASTNTTLLVNGNITAFDIYIFSMSGNLLSKNHFSQLQNIIDCTPFPDGMYFISLVVNNKIIQTEKLIINTK